LRHLKAFLAVRAPRSGRLMIVQAYILTAHADRIKRLQRSLTTASKGFWCFGLEWAVVNAA